MNDNLNWIPSPLKPTKRPGLGCCLLDVWGTGWCGPVLEPTEVVYNGLNLGICGVRFQDFLPRALTLLNTNPTDFIAEMAGAYGALVPHTLVEQLQAVIDLETRELTQGRILKNPCVFPAALPPSYTEGRAGMFEDVAPCLQTLKAAGVITALATNTWALTDLRKVMRAYGVDHLLDHVLVSGEMGLAKQAGAEFFLRCATIVGCDPSDCCVVDDNLQLGVVPGVQAGMKGVLVDRFRKYTDVFGQSLTFPNGSPKYPEISRLNIHVIQTLDDLPGIMGQGTYRAA